MKKIITAMVVCVLAVSAYAARPERAEQEVMKKEPDGTYVVNTTTLCDARGYKAQTPVDVYIKDGKVVKVVALRNQESKGYFMKVTKGLLPMYKGLKVSKARKLAQEPKVDATTGATYSSKAVQKNIKAALEYYQKHK